MDKEQIMNALCGYGFNAVRSTEDISILEMEIGYTTYVATIDHSDLTINGMPFDEYYKEVKQFLTKTI